MARTLCIPATVLLLAALVLSFLVSLSLPSLTSLDIVRLTVNGGLPGITTTSEIRMGIWTGCIYSTDGSHICGPKHLGYEVVLVNLLSTDSNFGIIKASWTRGLVFHTIATGFIFIAFLISLFESMTVNFVAFLVSSFATLMALTAFAIDIAFFALVHHLVKDVGAGISTKTAPGFWLAFVSLVLCIFASVALGFGRKRERRSSESTSYPMETSKSRKIWEKFNGDA